MQPKKKLLKKKKVLKKKQPNSKETFKSFTTELKIISVFDELPPDTNEQIVFYDKDYGWEKGHAKSVRQHVVYDHSQGYDYRTVLWAKLPKIKGE